MRGTLRYRAGAWRLQVYAGIDPATGKKTRLTRTFHSPDTRAGRKAAERALAEFVLEVESGRELPGNRELTLEELLDRWQRTRAPEWSPKTTAETRRIISGRILPTLGDRTLHRVRASDLDALYASQRASGGRGGAPLSAATVRKVHVILHSALGQAVRWGLIATNPADAATPPRVQQPDINPPPTDQVARALEAVEDDPALSAYLWLAATTGARRGQLVALQWGDIDLEAGSITFHRAITLGDAGPVVKGTKTGRRYRVAVDPETLARVNRWLEVSREAARTLRTNITPTSWVFTHEPGNGAPWRPDLPTNRWIRLRRRLGLDEIRLHDLRHGVATQLLAAGVDVRTVAGRLGQSNPNVTLSTYAHFMPERDRDAAIVMSAILGTGNSDR